MLLNHIRQAPDQTKERESSCIMDWLPVNLHNTSKTNKAKADLHFS